jgi:pilus assembly protein Flp/PilA
MKRFRRFLRDNTGATAIEYAVLASLIGLVIIKAVTLTGTKVSTVFGEVGAALK